MKSILTIMTALLIWIPTASWACPFGGCQPIPAPSPGNGFPGGEPPHPVPGGPADPQPNRGIWSLQTKQLYEIQVSNAPHTISISGNASIQGLGCNSASPTDAQLSEANAEATSEALNYCSIAFGHYPQASVSQVTPLTIGSRLCDTVCPGQGGFGGCQGEPYKEDVLVVFATFNCTIPQ